MSKFNPDPSRTPHDPQPPREESEEGSFELPRSAARVLQALESLRGDLDDFSALRDAIWTSGAQDIPYLIEGAQRILNDEDSQPPSPILLAAMNELIEELGEYELHADKLIVLAERVLESARRRGDEGIWSKSSLQYSRLCLAQDPPQTAEAMEHLEEGLDRNARAFGPLVGRRGYDLLEELCTLAELQQGAVNFDGATQTCDIIETVLEHSGSRIDANIIWAARVVADIRASTGNYQQAAEVLSDLLLRADGMKGPTPRSSAAFEEGIRPEDQYLLGIALRDYGDILLSIPGHAPEAEIVLRRAEVILDEGTESIDPNGVYLNVMVSLADALSAQGRFEEAMALKQRYGES